MSDNPNMNPLTIESINATMMEIKAKLPTIVVKTELQQNKLKHSRIGGMVNIETSEEVPEGKAFIVNTSAFEWVPNE